MVLDGYGGTHRGGTPAGPGVWWPNWDIARSVAVSASNGGVYLLDGYGGVTTSGDARKGSSGYWPGRDVARSVAAASRTRLRRARRLGHPTAWAPPPTAAVDAGSGVAGGRRRRRDAVAVRADGFSQHL